MGRKTIFGLKPYSYYKRRIKPDETVIDSNWESEASHLTRKQSMTVQRRIRWLEDHYLKRIMFIPGATLFQDPQDHRY